MSGLDAFFILLAGIGAGAINAVVGSGTLITFPTLLAFGIPPVTANVSNTVGLAPGSLSGAIGYRAELTGHVPVGRLGAIQRNARALLQQVNNLLDLARIDADRMPMAYANVDLVALVREILDGFEAAADDRHITMLLLGEAGELAQRVAARERRVGQPARHRVVEALVAR